ncbi:Fic family protein [Patulibacter sp. SYSU D01012]|uniref:Fic/DOC family protein n=1 Tax=Patulibacter sp. SYSU D01012 TaxID=2817381 RepID=UPI001B300FEA
MLRNELGITDPDELRLVETRLSAIAHLELLSDPPPATFDLAHLQAIHARLFAGLYAWAGQLRTVPLSKPGALFCQPEHLETSAREVFAELRRAAAPRLSREDFVGRLAHHIGNVNALHPFREGNGRATRELFRQRAAEAGFRLDWSRLDPERNIIASRAAMNGNLAAMRELLDPLTERRSREHSADRPDHER